MDAKAVIEYITAWIADYAGGARTDGLVIGISGGVDSAVSSVLAARTGLPTHCIALPIHQAASHTNRAAEQIAFLQQNFPNVSSTEADLSAFYDDFITFFPKGCHPERCDLTRANTRSRLRMVALYYMAGINNALVVGTGNKIEDFGVGFFTKYGDGGVDISPIGDLTKSEVYVLARELGIPRSILDAPPSDGLFDDEHTDEHQLGATYPELEQAMEHALQGGTLDTLSGRDRKVFGIYLARHHANRHKMEPIPICKVPEHLKKRR